MVIGNRKDGILFEPALTVHRLQFMVEDRYPATRGTVHFSSVMTLASSPRCHYAT